MDRSSGLRMEHATYVLFAPSATRTKLRQRLRELADAEVQWTERKGLKGSEFYIVGPPALAREAHLAAATWLGREIEAR
jgi:hypothetical protein